MVIRIRQIKVALGDENKLWDIIAKKLGIMTSDILDVNIQKKSLDARRKKDIHYVYEVDVKVKEEMKTLMRMSSKDIFLAPEEEYHIPCPGNISLSSRPVVVGSGPAGLFCAYMLAKSGYHPLIIDGNLDSIDIENNIKSKNIDYIILANEDYINNNIYSISYLCDKYSIPLINTDISEAVNTAILFSLDFNYYYLGRQLALVLNEVINNNGKTEGVDFLKLSDSYEILVNEDIAEEYDIKLTEEIHNISSFLIKDGKVIKK